MAETEFISIKHLAKELGMDRSHARRYILGLGLQPQKRRTSDSGSQLTLTLTEEEAQFALQRRREQGFLDSQKVIQLESGVFYVIQLIPELDRRRIKLGFAIDINERLLQHRTAAPTAKVVKTWPCKRSWELTVMDCLSSAKCRLILNEVFECDDLEMLIDLGEKFFGLLPHPNSKNEIAEYSPLKRSDHN